MSINGIDQAVAPPDRRRGAVGEDALRPAPVLRRLVARQRARTDRHDGQFSLLVFHLAEPRYSSNLESAVLDQFGEASDSTEAASWLSEGELAVMLAGAGAAGADQFAQRVATHLGADAASVRWSRHTYPDRHASPETTPAANNGDRRQTSNVPAAEASAQQLPGASAIIGPAAAAAANGPAYAVGEDGLAIDSSAIQDLLVKPQPWWKRALDVTASALAIAVLAPLLAPVALWIKLVSPGPVFFRQQRVGVGGRPFTMWKFRTVEVSDAADRHSQYVAELMTSAAPAKKLDHQLPIIPLGRALRRLGIDELPQLVNVLRGDMSLVGPRPDVIPYAAYPLWQRRRFDVLPGITGLWQVSGKNNTTFIQMINLDIQYVVRRSLWLDVAILLRTIPAMMTY